MNNVISTNVLTHSTKLRISFIYMMWCNCRSLRLYHSKTEDKVSKSQLTLWLFSHLLLSSCRTVFHNLCLHFYSGASAESPPELASHSEYRLQVFFSAACPASPPPLPPSTDWADCQTSGFHPSSLSQCPSKWVPFRPASRRRGQRVGDAAWLWRRPGVTQETQVDPEPGGGAVCQLYTVILFNCHI